MHAPLLIEQTSKRWKRQMIIAFAVIVLGVVSCTSGAQSGANGTIALGGGAACLGIAWWFYARLMAWWHHR